MSKPRIELKVGAFVFVGLILLAVSALLLSKGLGVFTKTMQLKLKSSTVGGIKGGANVLMAGVEVGRVSKVELGHEGTNVTIFLKVLARHKIYSDARFTIEQAGFLGDQHVSIYPGKNEGRLLTDGEEVIGVDPFNLQATISQATDTISRIGAATTNVDAAISDMRKAILNQEKLSRLGEAIDNFAGLAASANSTLSNLNVMVTSNTLPVSSAVSNLHEFSAALVPLAARLTGIITNNEDEIAIALKNVEIASAALTNLMGEIQTGKGPVGRLIYDEKMAADLTAISQNLSITTSNLNRNGLWSILWKKKQPRTESSSTGSGSTATSGSRTPR